MPVRQWPPGSERKRLSEIKPGTEVLRGAQWLKLERWRHAKDSGLYFVWGKGQERPDTPGGFPDPPGGGIQQEGGEPMFFINDGKGTGKRSRPRLSSSLSRSRRKRRSKANSRPPPPDIDRNSTAGH